MHTVDDKSAPVAAIDIGTNSVKCLIARVRDGQVTETLLDTAITTRLGEGLGATGRLGAIPIERTAGTVSELVASARRLGARLIRITGTSAVRECSNPEDLKAPIAGLTGLNLEILSGEEEARLAYMGAVGITARSAAMIDVGGGSTEWAVGDGAKIVWRRSFPVGAVRLTESFLHSDPPASEEVRAVVQCARKAFQSATVVESVPIVAVGGTARLVALVALAGRGSGEGFRLTLSELNRQIALYASTDLIQRRQIPGMEAVRAEIILAGAIILSEALTRSGVSEACCTLRGLRHGVVLNTATNP